MSDIKVMAKVMTRISQFNTSCNLCMLSPTFTSSLSSKLVYFNGRDIGIESENGDVILKTVCP